LPSDLERAIDDHPGVLKKYHEMAAFPPRSALLRSGWRRAASTPPHRGVETSVRPVSDSVDPVFDFHLADERAGHAQRVRRARSESCPTQPPPHPLARGFGQPVRRRRVSPVWAICSVRRSEANLTRAGSSGWRQRACRQQQPRRHELTGQGTCHLARASPPRWVARAACTGRSPPPRRQRPGRSNRDAPAWPET